MMIEPEPAVAPPAIVTWPPVLLIPPISVPANNLTVGGETVFLPKRYESPAANVKRRLANEART
jgi:hypothetical protein